MEPVRAPAVAHALALAAARAARTDLVGVDLLPTGNGFVVLELNGAVDFRPVYAPGRNVFADAVAALLGDAACEPELAAVAG
jgi:glutathione synthase/RimK-type ligase-like ATP-grasp enzyme